MITMPEVHLEGLFQSSQDLKGRTIFFSFLLKLVCRVLGPYQRVLNDGRSFPTWQFGWSCLYSSTRSISDFQIVGVCIDGRSPQCHFLSGLDRAVPRGIQIRVKVRQLAQLVGQLVVRPGPLGLPG